MGIVSKYEDGVGPAERRCLMFSQRVRVLGGIGVGHTECPPADPSVMVASGPSPLFPNLCASWEEETAGPLLPSSPKQELSCV